MKIELLKTLKGSQIWARGTVFDDIVSPIPRDILKEADSGASTVKVTATEKPIVAVKTTTEIEKPVEGVPEALAMLHWVPAGRSGGYCVETPDPDPIVPQEKNILLCLEELIKTFPSVKEAAALFGVSYQTISRWRKGKNKPSEEAIIKIRDEYAKVNG